MAANPERRGSIWRRDLNDLVRDESGHLSPSKIGTLLGQWLAVKIILQNGAAIIENWDSLAILFCVLMAPQMFLKLVNLKYGTPANEGTTTTTTATADVVTTTKGKK